ncbi:MAG: anaerobic ribonucleoside-triphosphate reductase activating protein [Oscillospiraceae bacterium]|nr:anaerobic ribonucleoside-triphosphate reductase activating protein [Oscillospiraceae bacterium]
MNYAAIKPCDIADGLGCRVSLFVSGCTHHCRGCFQPETWDFAYGRPFTAETQAELLRLLAPSYIHGLTLLGGEPFEPCSQTALLPLVEAVRQAYPEKDIWAYSGYTLEQLRAGIPGPLETTEALLAQIDVLVDGPFIEARKQLDLRFRGSANQRLIDLKKTMAQGEVVLWDDRQ